MLAFPLELKLTGICSGEDEYQNAAIKNSWKSLDATDLDCNNERAGSSRGTCCRGGQQLRGVIRYDHTQEEDENDIEEQDSVEGESYGTRDDLSRVLALPYRHTHKFSAEIRKYSSCENTPEAQEVPKISG